MISPLRRYTVNVAQSKMPEVLAFYEKGLGWKRFYESTFESKAGEPGEGALLGIEGDALNHTIVLQGGDSTVGMIGLNEFLSPQYDIKPFIKESGKPFSLTAAYAVDRMNDIYFRALEYGGTKAVEPHLDPLPGRGAEWQCDVLDPVGVHVILTESSAPTQPDVAKTNPLRRFTMRVARGGLEMTRRFYEEVVEMRVCYDAELEGTGLGVGGHRVHLLSLQQGDSALGMVGLVDYLEPCLDIRPFERDANGLFPFAMVFRTDEIGDVYKRARAFGAHIVCPPLERHIPGRGMCPGMTCLDPNGALLVFSQLPAV